MNKVTYGRHSLIYWSSITGGILLLGIVLSIVYNLFFLFAPTLIVITFNYEFVLLKNITIFDDRFVVERYFFKKEKEVVFFKDIKTVEPKPVPYEEWITQRHPTNYYTVHITHKDDTTRIIKLYGIMWFDKNKIFLELSKYVDVIRFKDLL